MIVRLRSRDGLERIEVPDNATVADLRKTIHQKLNIPLDDIQLSKNQQLLSSQVHGQFTDLANAKASLKTIGVQHGDIIFMLYHIERTVDPGFKRSEFESTLPGGCRGLPDCPPVLA